MVVVILGKIMRMINMLCKNCNKLVITLEVKFQKRNLPLQSSMVHYCPRCEIKIFIPDENNSELYSWEDYEKD